MHIGQIVTDDQQLTVSDFIKVVSPDDYKDDGTITLIVGKGNVNRLFPDYKLKYLDRKIDERHYWTFSKFEKRNICEYDIKKFRNLVFNEELSKVKYIPLDIVYSGYTHAKECIEKLHSSDKKYAYVSENSIYIYYDEVIYGISLLETRYIGIPDERVINYISCGTNVSMIYSDRFIGMSDSGLTTNIKYMPYLYFISNS